MNLLPKRKILLCLLWLTAVVFLPLTGCSLKKSPGNFQEVSRTGLAFDTVITITIYEGGSEELLDRCMQLAAHYESLLSPYAQNSDIWNVNHSGGAPVTIHEDTLEVLKAALDYAELSEGIVDPAIGSLSFLWNFGSDSQKLVPDAQAVREALTHVNYRSIRIEDRQVTLTDPETQLDLGFIAKGFIGDRIKEYLVSQGVSSALINLGGNVVAIGSKPDQTPFRVGIQKPFKSSGIAALTLDLADSSLVSSGNYQRYFEKDGTLYHHILSTKTGYPADSGLSQVSILCDSSMDCDAFSTLCFILGYEKAAALLKNYPDIQAVFTTPDGGLLYVNF